MENTNLLAYDESVILGGEGKRIVKSDINSTYSVQLEIMGVWITHSSFFSLMDAVSLYKELD